MRAKNEVVASKTCWTESNNRLYVKYGDKNNGGFYNGTTRKSQ